jgi:MoaA/NifB/PqqE/SkfB family radical SAM enzyme
MGDSLFNRVLEQANKEGVTLMVFLGGESLLDKNLYKYLNLCWENGISTALQTNGINLTEESLEKLKAAHIQNISITMHDARREHHDEVYRVPGAFETVSKAIEFAKKNGITITLKAVFSGTSHQDGSFLRILEMAKKHGLELNVNPFMPVGDGLKSDARLTDGQKKYFRDLAFSDATISSHLFYRRQLTACFAGAYYFCISPKGDILPCGFLPVSVGNIKTISLSEAHDIVMGIPLFSRRVKTCFIAESESFYRDVLVPIHEKYKQLPVNMMEHPDVYDMIAKCDVDKL